jgi:hypothetical protein
LVRPAGPRSALRVASDDQKRGVLGREQINELNEAIAEYIQLVKESLEYKSGDGRRQARSRSPLGHRARSCRAGKLRPRRVSTDCGRHPARVRHRRPLSFARRLDGIGAAAEAEPDEPPDIVALVSVGAVTSAQLDLLLRRVRLTFPQSQIVIGYWQGEVPRPDGGDERICHAESAGSLIDLVGRKADEKSQKADQPSDAPELPHRHLQVAAGA